MPPDELPKLKLAPKETTEELLRRKEREQRTLLQRREADLDQSLGTFRVGSVPYLNAVPLTRGLEDEMIWAPPSELAELLREGHLDAALLSITEPLFSDRYDILDGVAVASLGEVKSVLLAHRQPLPDIQEIFCDPASLASVSLLRVLLAEQSLYPEFKPLPDVNLAELPDATMLIGDRAIEFLLASHDHHIWDLGAAWYELTSLPFVYAVWALKRRPDNQPLRTQLREAKDFGLQTLDAIILNQTAFNYDFRKDYLSWHIHYHLGSDEKRGITRFAELLAKHHLGPTYPLHFVP